MGFVKTWQQLAGLRVLLGFLEAGFFPGEASFPSLLIKLEENMLTGKHDTGCVFLIQTWYTRFETQKRIAIFYLVGMIVVGFTSILAYAFSKLDGTHGIAGWSWIFIVRHAHHPFKSKSQS